MSAPQPPYPNQTDPSYPPAPQPAGKKPWYRRWWAITGGVLVVLMIIGGVSGGGETDTPADTASTSQADDVTGDDTTTDVAEEEVVDVAEEEPAAEPVEEEEPAEPAMTASQENAVGAAENYLDFTAFSKKGLIRQAVIQGGRRVPEGRRGVRGQPHHGGLERAGGQGGQELPRPHLVLPRRADPAAVVGSR